MSQITEDKWHIIFTLFCHSCFMFWKREGNSIAVAFDKAREETLKLRNNPFKPKGEPVNLKALQKWGKQYNQSVVETMYEYEKDDSIGDLRLCQHCGFPILEGYYIFGDFFCCDQCAIDGSYHGDKKQFEQDLQEAEDQNNPIWSDVYWSQWDDPIDE